MSEITYSRHGDFMLPDLMLPEQPEVIIGKSGLLRRSYMKTHRRVLYVNLLTSGKLQEHLAEIDEKANDRLELLMKQMTVAQGVTEQLQANDQMAWAGAMKNIKACAEEIVCAEIVYSDPVLRLSHKY